MSDTEDCGDLLIQAEGRARFLRDRGEIKTPDLIDELKADLAEAQEIIGAAHDYLSCDWFPHKSRNGNDKAAIESRARTFLNKNKSA